MGFSRDGGMSPKWFLGGQVIATQAIPIGDRNLERRKRALRALLCLPQAGDFGTKGLVQVQRASGNQHRLAKGTSANRFDPGELLESLTRCGLQEVGSARFTSAKDPISHLGGCHELNRLQVLPPPDFPPVFCGVCREAVRLIAPQEAQSAVPGKREAEAGALVTHWEMPEHGPRTNIDQVRGPTRLEGWFVIGDRDSQVVSVSCGDVKQMMKRHRS